MTIDFVLILVGFLLALLSAIGVNSPRVHLLSAAIALYLLSLLV